MVESHSSPEITTPVPPPRRPKSIPGLDRTTPSIRTGSPPSSNGIEDSGKRTVLVLVSLEMRWFNLTDRGVLEQWDDIRPLPPVATRATHRSSEFEATIKWMFPGEISKCEESGAQEHEIEQKCGDSRHRRCTHCLSRRTH